MSNTSSSHSLTLYADPCLSLHPLAQPMQSYLTARSIRRTTASLAKACATAQTSDAVGTLLLEQVCTLLPVPTAALVLRDPQYGDAIIRLAHGVWSVRLGMRLPAGVGLCGRVMETRQMHICHPTRCTAWCEWPSRIEDIYSIIGVPLLHERQMIGVLVLGHPAELTDSALHLLAAIARLAASAFATLPEDPAADPSR